MITEELGFGLWLIGVFSGLMLGFVLFYKQQRKGASK
jgi:hypothetical protein